MKLNDWSVVKTADKKGLALKPFGISAHCHMEVCVAIRDGAIEVNVYVDGVYDAVTTLTVPANKIADWRSARVAQLDARAHADKELRAYVMGQMRNELENT